MESQWTDGYHNHKINKDQYRVYEADEADKEIEQLKKEREWLISNWADHWIRFGGHPNYFEKKEMRERIVRDMQQALKELS